jgi:hypothetical protein
MHEVAGQRPVKRACRRAAIAVAREHQAAQSVGAAEAVGVVRSRQAMSAAEGRGAAGVVVIGGRYGLRWKEPPCYTNKHMRKWLAVFTTRFDVSTEIATMA